MHQKYAAEGLVLVTVSLDPANDKEAKEGVRKFLRNQQANFTNLLLDEPLEFWQDKLRFSAAPCYYVFNRQGKWTQFRGEDEDGVNYPAMDRLIVEFLKEKHE